MTVAELSYRMSSVEFSEWMEYAVLEPFGPLREDYRAGVIASVIAEVYRNRKERRQPFTPDDFFPAHDAEPAKPMSIFDKIRAVADDYNAAYYAKHRDKAPN